MGNRVKSVQDRLAQSYRNAGARWLEAFAAEPRRRPDGELRRNEGRQNWPYGPTAKHSHTGVLALKKARDRHEPVGPDHSRDDEKRVMLEAKTRDELRAICKAQNVQGYGKMNKAQLIEAALV